MEFSATRTQSYTYNTFKRKLKTLPFNAPVILYVNGALQIVSDDDDNVETSPRSRLVTLVDRPTFGLCLSQ